MNWQLFWATFATIFVAELGDKTQFAAMAASSASDSKMTVMLAVVIALGVAGALGVIVGGAIGHYIPEQVMKAISGAAFILLGLWTLFK